jgi:hypothetical protein
VCVQFDMKIRDISHRLNLRDRDTVHQGGGGYQYAIQIECVQRRDE